MRETGARMDAPLALVLAGGGARAAYQVGVLCAIAEQAPALEFPILTGVSAGAINAVYLAAHRGPLTAAAETLRAQWSRLTVDRVYRIRPMRIGRAVLRSLAQLALGRRRETAAVRGILDMEPLREFLASGLDLSGIDANIAAGRLQAAALSATSYASGDTVTFVHGPPDVPTWRRALRHAVRAQLTIDHVMASAALPILFSAVRVGDDFYGDGSVRQTAPLAPAIHLGARALLVITQAPDPGVGSPAPRLRRYPTLAERSEEHTSELQSRSDLVCRLLLEKTKTEAAQVLLARFVLGVARPTEEPRQAVLDRTVQIRWAERTLVDLPQP